MMINGHRRQHSVPMHVRSHIGRTRDRTAPFVANGRRSSTSFRGHTHMHKYTKLTWCETSIPGTFIDRICSHSHTLTHCRTRSEHICVCAYVFVSVCLCACARECARSPVHLYLSKEYNSLISFREHNRKSSWNCASFVLSHRASSRFIDFTVIGTIQHRHRHKRFRLEGSNSWHIARIYIHRAKPDGQADKCLGNIGEKNAAIVNWV